MRFLIPVKFKEDVNEWIKERRTHGSRFSNWFPFYYMPGTTGPAIMANIDDDDALAFALTFEHEKVDKK